MRGIGGVLDAALVQQAVAGLAQESQLVRVMGAVAAASVEVVDVDTGRAAAGALAQVPCPGTHEAYDEGRRLLAPGHAGGLDGLAVQGLGGRLGERRSRGEDGDRRRGAGRRGDGDRRVGEPGGADELGQELGEGAGLAGAPLVVLEKEVEARGLVGGHVQEGPQGAVGGGRRGASRILGCELGLGLEYGRWFGRGIVGGVVLEAPFPRVGGGDGTRRLRERACHGRLGGRRGGRSMRLDEGLDLSLRELDEAALPGLGVGLDHRRRHPCDHGPSDLGSFDQAPDPGEGAQALVEAQDPVDHVGGDPRELLGAGEEAGEGLAAMEAAAGDLGEQGEEALATGTGGGAEGGELGPEFVVGELLNRDSELCWNGEHKITLTRISTGGSWDSSCYGFTDR